MICQKCNNNFPQRQFIDGKWRKLSNRKYCLTCSPFGVHNTVKLHFKDQRKCISCGKTITRKNEKGKKCWVCTNKESKQKKIVLIQTLIGTSCWICGYNKTWAALDLHHVFPETKLFQLTTRELQFSWGKIETELRKCALLCCRCHREFHEGLINNDIIIKLWQEKWANSTMVVNPAHNG